MVKYYRVIYEPEPGEKWRHLFTQFWPYYERWFLSEGERARAGYLTSYKRLREHMPELAPIYEQLVDLAGGQDLPARFLTLWKPPPFMSGCSQAVWLKGFPALVRNYDYSPLLYEANIMHTNWLRPVIAMGDCLWGALDGMNDAGLCVSLAFGGSKATGEGFGIPLVLRYLLETCSTTKEAVAVLNRLPVHMSYNVTVLDAQGQYRTAFLAPGRAPEVTELQCATNHQSRIEWEAYAAMSQTEMRRIFLDEAIAYESDFNRFVRHFLERPLYSTQFMRGFGTLYTCVYYPESKSVDFLWPGFAYQRSITESDEFGMMINLQ